MQGSQDFIVDLESARDAAYRVRILELGRTDESRERFQEALQLNRYA